MNDPRPYGDEVWHRLHTWTNGAKAAERLAAQILAAENFTDIDPSHPLGGPDGKKDITCKRTGLNWIVGVYFPVQPQRFSSVKRKFTRDLKGVSVNASDGFVFVTNQSLTLGQRNELKASSQVDQVEVYHLERLVHILSQPANYQLRYDYLGIEMSKTEAMAVLANTATAYKQVSAEIQDVKHQLELIRRMLEKLLLQ